MLLMLFFTLIAFLIQSAYSATASPSWTANPLLNSGEHKSVFQKSGSGIAPGTYTTSQTFNVAFSNPPRVILSLQGYRQNPPCSGCNVGFKYEVSTIKASSFTGSYTIYGANVFILFYNYLGVSSLASEYFTSYELMTFSSGNLIDKTSNSRIITQIINNPAGQSFPLFPSNPIKSHAFLVGFKMNLGTTGTYINFTSTIVSPTSYSVTIQTIADVQIFQICYFRIAYDLSVVQAGYVIVSDFFYFWGVNSTQQTTVTTLTPAQFQYRNYMMGFNKIYLASATTESDIILQFYTTPQIIYSTSSVFGNFSNTVYAYAWADTFHQRKRVCPAATPYFYFPTFLCYDVCPQRTYAATPENYCQSCHYSCLSCNGIKSTNCLSCSDTELRKFDNTTFQCLCQTGYFQNGASTCATCSAECLTCSSSASSCLSCNAGIHFRTINLKSHTCPCTNGYYETSTYVPLVCMVCEATCLTCSFSASYCTSCDPLKNRVFNNLTNSCQCSNGFYETSFNNPIICQICDSTCLTCSSTARNCTSCNRSQNRALDSVNKLCICIAGFHQTSLNTPEVCLPCSPICATCSPSTGVCLSCDFTQQKRTINSSSQACICSDGYYQTSSGNPAICIPCDISCLTCSITSTNCMTCDKTLNRNLGDNNTCSCSNGFYQSSQGSTLSCQACSSTCLTCKTTSTNCITCDLSVQHRLINTNTSVCECQRGYYEINLNEPTICLQCNPTCIICANSTTNCLSCDLFIHHRSLDLVSKSCRCIDGFYQISLNSPTICLHCSSTCLSCSSANNCTSCNSSQNRKLNLMSNQCQCISGYYEVQKSLPLICLICDSNCAACSINSTFCTSCDTSKNRIIEFKTNTCKCMDGYYEDTANHTACKPCSIVGCTFCAWNTSVAEITCNLCNAALNFVLNKASTCTCAQAFYFEANLSQCISCSYKCLTCLNQVSCSTCSAIHYRYLNLNISNFCQCLPGYYDSKTKKTCLSCDAKCLTCLNSVTNCSSCDTSKRFYISKNETGDGDCQCNIGTEQSDTGTGECRLLNASQIFCSNGIIQVDQQCDDFNTISGDGCSSLCHIQQNHACSFYSNRNGTSLCFYNQPLKMDIASVFKQLDDNKINVVLSIQALLCNLENLKQYLQKTSAIELISNRRLLQSPSESQLSINRKLIRRIAQTRQILSISSANFIILDYANYQGQLTLTLDYTESISTLKNKQLQFIGSNSQHNSNYFFNTPQTLTQLQDPYNNIPMNFYPVSQYQITSYLSWAFLILCSFNLAFFVILGILRKSVISIQNMLIMQAAYFCILCQKQVELAIGSLAYWGKLVFGININIVQISSIDNILQCSKMWKIYQSCSVINNINITFIIAILLSIFVIVCNIYKCIKQAKMNQKQQNNRQTASEKQSSTSSNQNSIELQNQQSSQQQKSTDTNFAYISFYFPQKVKKLNCICLECIFGICFLIAVQCPLSIISQGPQFKIYGIIQATIITLFFTCVWAFWIKSYPTHGLSYFQILKYQIQKISLQKLAYLSLFVLLVAWGSIISIVPGIVSYCMLISIQVYWLILTIYFQIYKHKLNKIRALVNQLISISIAVVFILLQYMPNDGLGLGYAISVLILLLFGIVNNLGFSVYLLTLHRKNYKINDEGDSQSQNMEQYDDSNSSAKSYRSQKIQQLSEYSASQISERQYRIVTPKRQSLLQDQENHKQIRGKSLEQNNFTNRFKTKQSLQISTFSEGKHFELVKIHKKNIHNNQSVQANEVLKASI